MATKSPKVRTTIIPASPGTRAIVFGMRDYDTVPDDGQPVFDRMELTVIAWAVQEIGDLGVGVERWANPVFSQPILTDGHHVIVHPDGKPDFPHPFPNHEEGKGTTIDEFEKYIDRMFRNEILELRCLDCGKLAPLGEESPVLKHAIWLRIVKDGKGRLCREHMEQRLGRTLTPNDLVRVPTNRGVFANK